MPDGDNLAGVVGKVCHIPVIHLTLGGKKAASRLKTDCSCAVCIHKLAKVGDKN